MDGAAAAHKLERVHGEAGEGKQVVAQAGDKSLRLE
jgi:hypothetical protein